MWPGSDPGDAADIQDHYAVPILPDDVSSWTMKRQLGFDNESLMMNNRVFFKRCRGPKPQRIVYDEVW